MVCECTCLREREKMKISGLFAVWELVKMTENQNVAQVNWDQTETGRTGSNEFKSMEFEFIGELTSSEFVEQETDQQVFVLSLNQIGRNVARNTWLAGRNLSKSNHQPIKISNFKFGETKLRQGHVCRRQQRVKINSYAIFTAGKV